MTPDEDPTWPECSLHEERHWCSETRMMLARSSDARHLEPGIRFCVPLYPNLSVFVEAAIDTEKVRDEISTLFLVKKEDVFAFDDKEELVPVSLWLPGEGRRSASGIIQSWARGITPDPELCQNKNHGFSEEESLESIKKVQGDYIKVNHWRMITASMCMFCFNRSKNIDIEDLTGQSIPTVPHLGQGGAIVNSQSQSWVNVNNVGPTVVNGVQAPRSPHLNQQLNQSVMEKLKSKYA